ncbi:MAG: SlyX family protein [Gammaproteobacteria bacterium]|nr:SlyX family protein [Gammaproteobacteria bacterium]
MKTEEQIIELESRLAFQELSILELNEIITQQQKQLDKLYATVHMLDHKMRELAESRSGNAGESPQNERPPHY